MRRVISASRRVRKTGAVPVLGFTREKSSGVRGKQRSRSLTESRSWRKNAHSVWSNRRSSPLKTRTQNLNRPSTSGKNGGRSVPRRRFSKSNRPPTRPLVDTDRKNRDRRHVGIDAGRCEQGHETVGLDEAHGALDEERVQVGATSAEKWIFSVEPGQRTNGRGPFSQFHVFQGKFVTLIHSPVNQSLSHGSGACQRHFAIADGKPFYFLLFDPVPGRVADHGVEAALRTDVLPPVPHSGEGDLPVEEPLAIRDGAGVGPHGGEVRRRASPAAGTNVIDGAVAEGEEPVGVLRVLFEEVDER